MGYSARERHRGALPVAGTHRLGGEQHAPRHAGARLRDLRGPGARRADDASGRALGEGRGTGLRCLAAGAPGTGGADAGSRRRTAGRRARHAGRGSHCSRGRYRQRARRGQSVGSDAGRPPEHRPLPGRLFGLQGVYSRRTEPFALQYLWHRGVKVTILGANDQSWSARATHVSRPGKKLRHLARSGGPQRPATESQKRVPSVAGYARVRRLASDLGSSKPRQLLAAAAPP